VTAALRREHAWEEVEKVEIIEEVEKVEAA
jgi:hypothetical protein